MQVLCAVRFVKSSFKSTDICIFNNNDNLKNFCSEYIIPAATVHRFIVFAGRGRQMDAYVDDLFDPVLDPGPPVSDVLRLDLVFNVHPVINVKVLFLSP